ncbi:TPA: ATP-dependent endonuclease [Acinetobacter baumannii]|uniref:ATP-dependent nuclease n=1 Tax=Acinetobacter baumannii TaxID=470 RepID=UPI0022EC1DBF|nr:AAA family ATPase [Acinetobacter baumannii]HCS1005128.1 AAA family ATPase [Acinetobacter baumannii]
MKLDTLRISNFQSFGKEPTEILLEDISYLIGPNGSGKTSTLQAISRLFCFDPSLRRIQKTDFHIDPNEEIPPPQRELWIEANFSFPELLEDGEHSTIPEFFNQMRLDQEEEIPRVRYRLIASMGIDGDIEENLYYILDVDENNEPISKTIVPRSDRNQIQAHYLPARRDPSNHISFGTNALLGRLLRAINWTSERADINTLSEQINSCITGNSSISSLCAKLDESWKYLHTGKFFTNPKISFGNSEIEALLKHMSISFSPGHGETNVDYSRLSDGQKSMLYLSLVLSSITLNRAVISGEETAFDIDKLNPPVFSLILIEEPENSLSPHYLGRISNILKKLLGKDTQALIATHAPSILRRVDPEKIRYLRLDSTSRSTTVKTIILPTKSDEAHKFVREAVQAFPEVYFARLIVLGEGDSEEIVLPKLFEALDLPVDESAICIAPLGGRHVNHFWRLLATLKIPYVTLLDLDVARYQGGWGRIKYINDQFSLYNNSLMLPSNYFIPNWKDEKQLVRNYDIFRVELEKRNVFFSSPLDLDFSMLKAFPEAYKVSKETPDEKTIKSVLGKSYFNSNQYSDEEKELFDTYHSHFKVGSKPAAHIDGLSNINDEDLKSNMPQAYKDLATKVKEMLERIPE